MDDATARTARRLNDSLGPLRRAILRASRSAADLPDIPEAQIEVMRSLARTGESTPSELAEVLRLARSTVSNLLSQMERTGLIERRLVVGDGRRTAVGLTALASSRLRAFDESATAVLVAALSDLPPDDVAAITASLPALERLQQRIVTT